jgi:hypothetical protein
MALPVQSAAEEPGHVVRPVLDALLDMLPAAFVCVRLNDLEGGPSIEVEVAESWAEPTRVQDIRKTIALSLEEAHLASRPREHIVLGDVYLSVAFAPLGVRGDIGTLAAGSLRSDFPTQSERLLLYVAESQATNSHVPIVRGHGAPAAQRPGPHRQVARHHRGHAGLEATFTFSLPTGPSA